MTRYWLLKNMFYIGQDEQKNSKNEIVIIFLFISVNMCFGCSKELSQFLRVPTTYFG